MFKQGNGVFQLAACRYNFLGITRHQPESEEGKSAHVTKCNVNETVKHHFTR